MVTYDRVPIDPPRRWVSVILLPGWFVSHCLVMSRGEVLFDPTPPIPPRELLQASLLAGVPIRRRVWRADEVTEGFSFLEVSNQPKERVPCHS